MFTITTTWANLSGKPTIYSVLRDKLGREPTNAELRARVTEILREAADARLIKRATQGKLKHQRGRI